ncbi:hypothetical protein BF29_2532 [Heyndrickxia coagulans DSM 1 = ATCC 7050]|nr:hypothetical protein BF29_2609 [Heyndrickxia coagulans DSM 1 = ATCC 7050]AJH79606.1 hypothetical protein BF29_2532 [Heyndrickxia coagulans DSM 1 = ATCC 7050]
MLKYRKKPVVIEAVQYLGNKIIKIYVSLSVKS